VTRAGTWPRGPSLEWAHRLGASPPKRMAVSWSGSDAGPTEYKVPTRCYAPKWRAPLGSYSALAIRISRSREKRPAGRNQLDIEIPIQVPARWRVRGTGQRGMQPAFEPQFVRACEDVEWRYNEAAMAIGRDLEARTAAADLATITQAGAGHP